MKAIGDRFAPQKEYKERYIIRFNDRIIPLLTSNIAYVYSEEKNNYLVTFDEHKYIIDSSLDVISEELNPESFFRISRGCIISNKAIASIIKQNGLGGDRSPQRRRDSGRDRQCTGAHPTQKTDFGSGPYRFYGFFGIGTHFGANAKV